MKTLFKLFLITTILTLLTIPVYSQDPIKGIYKTYNSYVKDSLDKTYDRMLWGDFQYFLVKKEEKDPSNSTIKKNSIKNEDADIWGFRDNNGYVWRIIKKTGFVPRNAWFRVMATGKIWLYTNNSVSATADDKGNITALAVSDENNSTNNRFVLIQHGPDGTFQYCTKSILMKSVADNTDVAAKVKDGGVYTGMPFFIKGSWIKNFKEILAWVTEYNNSQKK